MMIHQNDQMNHHCFVVIQCGVWIHINYA